MAHPSKVFYEFSLYIFGRSGKSESAIHSIKTICSTHLKGRCTYEVIDLSETPQHGHEDSILATPTLIRRLPKPEHRIVGDLSKPADVLFSLNIQVDGKR